LDPDPVNLLLQSSHGNGESLDARATRPGGLTLPTPRTRLPPAEDLRHQPPKTPSASRRGDPAPRAADKVHGVAATRRVPGHGGGPQIHGMEAPLDPWRRSSDPLWSLHPCPFSARALRSLSAPVGTNHHATTSKHKAMISLALASSCLPRRLSVDIFYLKVWRFANSV
ncbi:unnamed protein product, partial [Urochloa humidicola]